MAAANDRHAARLVSQSASVLPTLNVCLYKGLM